MDAGAPSVPVPSDPRVAEVRSFLDGSLDVAVDPRTLFDVPLDDESAIQIESVRIRALLEAVDVPAPPDAGPPRRPARPVASATAPDASIQGDIAALDPSLWQARVALDRARLDFYALPHERREALLQAQADRREAAKPRETEEQRRAREAEAERQRALEAARAARSEAERLVSEELARLISVQGEVAKATARFRDTRASLAPRRDAVLGWQRRVRDAKAGSPADADATYDALRRALKASRDDLDHALDDLTSTPSEVPALGADPLIEIAADIPTDQVRERRAVIDREIKKARVDERSLREDRASGLLDEVDTLNRERLGLLPDLSPEKRAAITGFTSQGADQARSESRQLLLIVRYHRHIAGEWLRSIRGGGPAGISGWQAAAVLVPWFFLVYAFAWGRRRTPKLLALVEERVAHADRSERRVTPGAAHRVLSFLSRVHGSMEWLLFFGATMWLLPAVAKGLLEVQLVASIVGWTLAGAMVVDVINAVAAGSATTAPAEKDGGRLRLRSLRLVGRVVVVFVLVFVLSARLVGEGTVYSWVLSTRWPAGLAVFLILVRWWRARVFERVERIRKKSPVQAWMLANRVGWKSFLAAMIAAVHLFLFGAVKVVRNWLAGFNLARRADAYLFKRELDRLATGKSGSETVALRSEAFESLTPDSMGDTWIKCPIEERLARLHARVKARRGGILAIVGSRGLGKSSILRSLAEQEPATITISCLDGGSAESIRAGVFPHEKAAADASPSTTPPPLVLLDDVQGIIRPIIGGLATFDEVLALARAHGSSSLWVFAIDAVLWPFIQRARDARPLFDEVIVLEPWAEEQIGDLLTQRSAQAGVAPTFEDLLDKLPPSADEVDRQDALKAKHEGYVRMLWDHVGGNPGTALEVWRSSLVEDAEGSVRVRPLQVPDPAELERLPDSALFILRAVLQLAPASAADVALATRLTHNQIVDAFRFGEAHGYLVETARGVRITWRWFRPIVRHLERRHLLVNP
ncbi:MAG: hypothetical protein ABJE95_11910 [Byssovorax sp.]